MKTTETYNDVTLDNLYQVNQFVAKWADKLTASTLRYQMRHRHENGLAQAIVPLGRYEMICEPRYFQWLASRAGKA